MPSSQRQEGLAQLRGKKGRSLPRSTQRQEGLALRKGRSSSSSGGGGGVLGFLGRFGSDLEHAAVSSPAGLYALAKAELHDIGAINEALHRPSKFRDIHLQTPPIARQMASQTVEDIRHPLRHPGNTLLDVLGAASLGGGAVARLGAAGKAARTGGSVTRALLTKPVYTRKVLGREVPASANPIVRGAQKASTRWLEKKAAAGNSAAQMKLYKQGRKTVAAEVRLQQKLANAEHATVAYLGRKLTKPQLQAFRVVAEGRPLEEVQHFHEQRIAELKSGPMTAGDRLEIRRHREILKNLEQARKYVKDVDGKPAFRSGVKAKGGVTMEKVYAAAHKSAGSRETLIKRIGLMTSEGIETRKALPGRVVSGDEEFLNPEGIYISEARRRSPTGQVVTAVRGAIGRPRKPAGLTHSYGGSSKIKALETPNPVRRVAEQGLEMQRFASALNMRDVLARFGREAPLPGTELKEWRFLRLKPKDLPVELKSIIDKADRGEKLNEADLHGLAGGLQRLRDSLLQKPHDLTPDDLERIKELAKQGKGVFVPRHLTKEFEHAYVRLANVIGRRPTSLIDTVNNATKLAVLYLKVAYAVPNLLGNLALNLVQQGFLAPVNLARASVLARRLPPDVWAKIDTLMGEGLSTSLDTGRGSLAGAVHKAAGAWSKVVDVAPRRAAFLHEARRIGVKTPQQLERLLSGEDPRLLAVTERANDAIIDYGRLSTREQEITRRLIFFYPWVKGSTRYAGHFATEHSVQAAVLGQLGQLGAQTQEPLGPLPSWARGVFPVGERNGQVLTVNPASTSILGTPADLAATVANLASGRLGFQGNAMLTPAVQALISLVTQRDSLGRAFKGSPVVGTAQDLYQGVPAYVLAQRLRGKQTSRTYPDMTSLDALLQFLVGGLAPRPTNPTALNRSAFLERHPEQR